VLSAARDLIAEVPLGDWLEQFPDTEAALVRAGVPRPHHGWLFEQWVGQPAAFFVRWPLIGHAANHIGEMIATRNRMGLSPYGA
jgi:hypothetical protein